MQRYEELMHLKEYLNFRIQTREYEAKVAAANGNIAELRSQYVKDMLEKFDNAEKSRAEQEKWGWPHCTVFSRNGLCPISEIHLGRTHAMNGKNYRKYC